MIVFGVSCSHKGCPEDPLKSRQARKNQQSGQSQSAAEDLMRNPVNASSGAQAAATVVPLYERVRVAKMDGSLQCSQGKAVDPLTMAKQLGNIRIFSQAKKMTD